MSSEMVVSFPGGKRVDAAFGDYVLKTDQPPMGGGEGSAPSPYQTFLASIATCAGIYVLGFCQSRGIPTDGVSLVQRMLPDETGRIGTIEIEVRVPADFPEKYRNAVAKAAESCAVKKTIANPPAFEVHTTVG